MAVENSSHISVELNSDCNLHHSNNEIEMNFQYRESIDYVLLPSSWQNIEVILSMNENSQQHVCSKERKVAEKETSTKGLILKELLNHLKYAFLEPEKGKQVIISVAFIENEEQKLL